MLTDNEIIKALYYLYCAAGYKETVTMSKETAIGLYEYFNRQKAEIEDLKDGIEELDCELSMATDCIPEQRADAIKEFAERVKRYIDVGHLRPPTEICFSELDVVSMIDNLVKEMVGEDNEKV